MLTTIDDKNLYDIADAIRDVKGETANYKPSEMAGAIGEILAMPEEALTITGDMNYKFAYSGWNWFMETFGDKIKTEDITSLKQAFYNNSNITKVPFEINCKSTTAINLSEMFYNCSALTELPKINCKPLDLTKFIQNCSRLRELPEDIESWFDWSYIDNLTNAYQGGRSYAFYSCYSLRSIPMGFLAHNNKNVNNSYSIFYYGFTNCYVLDELVGIPISWHTGSWTSNAFYTTFDNCSRLQRLTFETKEDGTPYTMNWKSQTIDLSKYVGYTSSGNFMVNYNSGLTLSNRVAGTGDYETRSQTPDWWTQYANFSRYNHDSAVETINSLPDTSAYGTNTIKFKGASGSNTTGGAINTLTAEEIAVAAAKGWTVSLV